MIPGLPDRLRAAGKDERLATGQLYLEAADEIENLRRQVDTEQALLRELNDALVIPGWLQPRVDAVLDKNEGME